MIKAAIVGGSGYVGGELLRILLFHPKVKVISVTSQLHAGEMVSDTHHNLTKICNLKFQKENLATLSKKADVIFLALPHGTSMEKIKQIDLNKTKVIDLGADFRLKDIHIFEKVYGIKHTSPDKNEKVIYGLTELYKDEIIKAKMVACPGCFPTGALLALLPLAKNNLLSGNVIIDSKTGSSGSGIQPSLGTHHPERADDFNAYNIFSHRHIWEIIQEVSLLNKKKVKIIFTPHSAPMVRGIFTTCYVFLEKDFSEGEIKKIYEDTYKKAPFIRLVENPHVGIVAGTNYCDISVHVQDKTVIVTSAIDNLVKGAAGQAVQNMNLMFGLPETLGLEFPGTHP